MFWGQNLKFLSLFVFFCPFLSRLSPGLDNGATSFIPLHRESDKDSCNLLTDHIKQNVKRNKKRYVYQFFDYSMEIQIFSNSKFGQLRVALNEKGETVFCLADVCKALGIGNPSQVKTRLDGAALCSIEVCSTSVNQYGAKSVRTTKMTYIGEPNLYRCIFQSKKEEAKEFQDWVFNTVLPQIRKTGGYIPVSEEDDEKSILAKALNIMQRTLEEKDRLIEEQRPMAKLSVTPMITGKGQQHFLNLFCGEK